MIEGDNMKERIVLTAKEGMILTNGKIYGTEIFLAEGLKADDFREIPIEEYKTATQTETPSI